jgi:hypothetical protein
VTLRRILRRKKKVLPKSLKKTEYGQILSQNDPNPKSEEENQALVDANKYSNSFQASVDYLIY